MIFNYIMAGILYILTLEVNGSNCLELSTKSMLIHNHRESRSISEQTKVNRQLCKLIPIMYKPKNQAFSCENINEDMFLYEAGTHRYTNITEIYTRHVNMSRLPDIPKWLESVTQIVISNNGANMSLNMFKNFNKLGHVVVVRSEVKNYNGFYISTESSIKWLKFTFLESIKYIHSLCQGYYKMNWSLVLPSNQITSFPAEKVGPITCTSKLKELDLKNNKLTSFSTYVFHFLPALETIDLSFNQISFFNNSYNTLKQQTYNISCINVDSLFLDNNNISDLNEQSFKYFNQLKRLTLNHNSLQSLPSNTFNSLKNLRKLNLSNNNFQLFEIGLFSPLDRLEVLDISTNCLKQFDYQWHEISIPTSLSEMILFDNPWDTDKIKNLKKLLKTTVKIVSNKKDYINIKRNVCKTDILLEPSSETLKNSKNIPQSNYSNVIYNKEQSFITTGKESESEDTTQHIIVILVVEIILTLLSFLCIGWLCIKVNRKSYQHKTVKSNTLDLKTNDLVTNQAYDEKSCIYEEVDEQFTTATSAPCALVENSLYATEGTTEAKSCHGMKTNFDQGTNIYEEIN